MKFSLALLGMAALAAAIKSEPEGGDDPAPRTCSDVVDELRLATTATHEQIKALQHDMFDFVERLDDVYLVDRLQDPDTGSDIWDASINDLVVAAYEDFYYNAYLDDSATIIPLYSDIDTSPCDDTDEADEALTAYEEVLEDLSEYIGFADYYTLTKCFDVEDTLVVEKDNVIQIEGDSRKEILGIIDSINKGYIMPDPFAEMEPVNDEPGEVVMPVVPSLPNYTLEQVMEFYRQHDDQMDGKYYEIIMQYEEDYELYEQGQLEFRRCFVNDQDLEHLWQDYAYFRNQLVVNYQVINWLNELTDMDRV